MSQSILDALLAQYVTPYGGGAQPQMSAVQPPGGPQMSPAQGGPPPQQPGAPVPAEQEIAQAMMGVQDNQMQAGMMNGPMEALAAMESGAQPLMDKYAATQEQRFDSGIMGVGEMIYDMVQAKKLRPQVQAVRENEARLTREAAQEQADLKYRDAKTLLSEKYPNASKDEIDALSRRYAQGEDINIEPDVIEEPSIHELQKYKLDEKAAMMGLHKDQVAMAETIYDNAKNDITSFNKAEMNMKQINEMAAKGWEGMGAVQVGALYSMIKALDPDSVVREGEVRLAQMGESMINRMLATLKGIPENTIMSEEMFNDVVEFTQGINSLTRESFGTQFQDYVSQAESRGIKPELVFGTNLLERVASGGSPAGPISVSAKASRNDRRHEDVAEEEDEVIEYDAQGNRIT